MNCNPFQFLSESNPSSNARQQDIHSKYGAVSPIFENEGNSDDFGYVEFTGKDGRTCPTCNGTGRIAKHQEDELVALIPYNDNRLKPSRTKCYVLLAVTISLIASTLVLFFLLPRTVSIEQDKILSKNISVDVNTSTTTIKLTVRFNVTNMNFFDVDISNIAVLAYIDQVMVGSATLPKTQHVSVAARSNNFPVEMLVVTICNPHKKLGYISHLCLNSKRKVRNVVVVLQTTQTASYLGHSEQSSVTTYNYVDCNPDKSWWNPV